MNGALAEEDEGAEKGSLIRRNHTKLKVWYDQSINTSVEFFWMSSGKKNSENTCNCTSLVYNPKKWQKNIV